MRDFIRKLFPCIALSVSLVACGRVQLDEPQIVGKWVSNKDEKGPQKDGPLLMLRENRRFSAVNFPRNIFSSLPGHNSAVAKGDGAWKQGYSVNGQQVIELVFETGEDLKGRLPYGVTLFVTGTHGSPVLSLYLGDPDTDPLLDFVKEQTKK